MLTENQSHSLIVYECKERYKVQCIKNIYIFNLLKYDKIFFKVFKIK